VYLRTTRKGVYCVIARGALPDAPGPARARPTRDARTRPGREAKLLRTAVDWDVLREMPRKIKIPKSLRTPPVFYELGEMRRLIEAAASIDARTHALVLVGLHGGLREVRSLASNGATSASSAGSSSSGAT
jgi:hypothetical protein